MYIVAACVDLFYIFYLLVAVTVSSFSKKFYRSESGWGVPSQWLTIFWNQFQPTQRFGTNCNRNLDDVCLPSSLDQFVDIVCAEAVSLKHMAQHESNIGRFKPNFFALKITLSARRKWPNKNPRIASKRAKIDPIWLNKGTA